MAAVVSVAHAPVASAMKSCASPGHADTKQEGPTMYNLDDIIVEIELTVLVDGEPRRLEMPIPFDYDGQEIMRLIMHDIDPMDADMVTTIQSREADEGTPLADADDIAGQMDADAFEDWLLRANDLREIDLASYDLEDTGLLPGEYPGIFDLRTGEPTTTDLDETIEHDLQNATIVGNAGKAAFRAMREACGASQAALAEALGVSARAVKRWEAPGQPEPPSDARRLVESWHADAMSGANWHVRQAEELREEHFEAYTLVLYRNQEEFDQVLAPILANAPSYRWQDVVTEAREKANAEADGVSLYDVSHPYTNFPGTRSYWRANAAAKMAAVLMDARKIPYGFAYASERNHSLFWEGVWVPRADVQRIETANGTLVVCGMR